MIVSRVVVVIPDRAPTGCVRVDGFACVRDEVRFMTQCTFERSRDRLCRDGGMIRANGHDVNAGLMSTSANIHNIHTN